jgi:hypothetical protein
MYSSSSHTRPSSIADMIAIVAYATQERAAGNRKFDSIQQNYSGPDLGAGRDHSPRNAWMGSTEAARRAGTAEAARAKANTTTAPRIMTTGSKGLT